LSWVVLVDRFLFFFLVGICLCCILSFRFLFCFFFFALILMGFSNLAVYESFSFLSLTPYSPLSSFMITQLCRFDSISYDKLLSPDYCNLFSPV